jgi:hypothetical protein
MALGWPVREKVQVAHRVGVPGTVGTLVQAHGPAAHPFARFADPLGRQADVGLFQPGDGRHLGRGIVGEEREHGFPAFGMPLDELQVAMAVMPQQMQQAIEQGQVGAGAQLQEQVGLVGGAVAARVDHDQPGPLLDPVEQAQEQNRMTIGHVRATDEEQVAALEVGVTAGRPVGTQ